MKMRTSVYHCGLCEGETNVDADGNCPDGSPHEIDLAFHHRQAHSPDDPDPDCHLFEDAK